MADSPRLEELRRRVQADPASIAFAALAEEYRRAGKFREAVEASRAGLRYHPTYVSARVTLGRSLVELQEVEQAERELAFVLKSAPDNLAARRALGELCWQQLRFGDALDHFRTAHTLAPADTELPTILQSLERELAADRHGTNGKADASAVAVEAAAAAPAPAVAEFQEIAKVAEGAEPVVEAAAEPPAAPHVTAADEDTVILTAPPQLAATPFVDAMPQVDATPIVEAEPQVEVEAASFVEATPWVAATTDVIDVETVEHVAEFEPIDAVAFVDDHEPTLAAAPEAALPVVIEELPAVVDVVVDTVDTVDVVDAPTQQMNGRAHPPNPALMRLERFHRAILAARRRSQQQQRQQH